jgi:hypothetical protein
VITLVEVRNKSDVNELSGKIEQFKNGMSRDLLEKIFKYTNLSNDGRYWLVPRLASYIKKVDNLDRTEPRTSRRYRFPLMIDPGSG